MNMDMQTDSFVDFITNHGYPRDGLSIQTFDDAAKYEGRGSNPVLVGIRPYSEVLEELSQKGAGVFWTINPQEKPGVRGIMSTTHFWGVGLDIDIAKEGNHLHQEGINTGKQQMKSKLLSFTPRPTLIITSKNGLQPIWIFKEPKHIKPENRKETNEIYKTIVKGLGKAIHPSEGDSISRVFRLPGFRHQKNKQSPFDVTWEETGVLIDHKELIQYLEIKTDKTPSQTKKIIRSEPSIYDVPVMEALQKLSGHSLVDGQQYEFTPIKSNGTINIIIDGSETSQFINPENNTIGGMGEDPASVNIVDWVAYFNPEITKANIRKHLDKLLLDKERYVGSNHDSFQVDEYQVVANDNRYVTVRRENLEYKLKAVGNKHEVSMYQDGNLVHRDVLNLSSNHSRKRYAKECEDLDTNSIAIDLLKLTKCLDELNHQALNQEDETKEDKPSDEEVATAEELLASPVLLHQVLLLIKKLGVAGEEVTALLHYLVFTSRITDSPLSVVVKGESSVGKSYVVSKVMQLLPKDAFIDITDATAQSFFYAPEDHFSHKIIVIFELHGSDKADYSIRSLQSEGKLKIQVTIKDPETGEFRAKEKEVNGPTGFITTTTNAKIHSENETRHLSIFPDESIKQTELTFSVSDAKYRGVFPVSLNTLKPWQVLQTILKPYRVLIPYVEELRRQFPKEPVRVRRDYNKLLSMIEVIALLHQKQRQIIAEDEQEYVVASLVDFHIAKVLLENTFKKTIYAIPPKTELLINTAKEMVKAGNSDGVSVSDLAKKVEWDYDTAKKWFDPGYRKGYFESTREHKGSTAALYVPADKQLPSENILPFTEALFAKDASWLGEQQIYDPISGETYNLEPEE